MSGEKQIDRVRSDEYRNAPVGPVGTELAILTNDGWEYVFRQLTESDPFELHEKRRDDGSKSDCELIPKPVAMHFEETPNIELVNAHVAE